VSRPLLRHAGRYGPARKLVEGPMRPGVRNGLLKPIPFSSTQTLTFPLLPPRRIPFSYNRDSTSHEANSPLLPAAPAPMVATPPFPHAITRPYPHPSSPPSHLASPHAQRARHASYQIPSPPLVLPPAGLKRGTMGCRPQARSAAAQGAGCKGATGLERHPSSTSTQRATTVSGASSMATPERVFPDPSPFVFAEASRGLSARPPSS
jgi:hypothetical protein